MSVPFPGTCSVDDDCGPGFRCEGGVCVPEGGGGNPVNPLPGLGNWLQPRYTSNVAVTDEMSAQDLLSEVIFPSARLFWRQSAAGRLGIQNKKPAPYAFATEAVSVGESAIDFDNVEDWIGDTDTWLLVAPHTNKSEIHKVTGANYSTAQNSVVLSSTGGLFTVTGFSGCDGASTPATASIQVTSASATACSITLDAYTFHFTTSTSDTTVTIAAYIAGVIASYPSLRRRFKVAYTEGSSTVNLTARFGTLTLDSPMLNAHNAPLADPVTAPTLTASGSGSNLKAGLYSVVYSAVNAEGETLLSKYKTVTITAGQNIVVSSITLPTGATGLKWYVSPEAGSPYLRYYSTNTGAGFTISSPLPKLSAPLPPDLNRTGVEVIKVKAVFSDRGDTRTSLSFSNVLKASYSWLLGNRSKTINQVNLKYRNAADDWRSVERRIRDDAHIAKVKKTNKEDVNGQAIDNTDQAIRIAAGRLAEQQDADFFYKLTSLREAMLLQEGDVVACTDDGSGVYNIPVMIEEIEYNIESGSMPVPGFQGRKYSSRLYDDSPVEAAIPVVSEDGV